MSILPVDKCPTCNRPNGRKLKCDQCGKVDDEMPITVTITGDGGLDEDHFCSVACMRKYDPPMGTDWWHRTTVNLDPRLAMQFADAVQDGEVSDPKEEA